jgi:hypothetical protein
VSDSVIFRSIDTNCDQVRQSTNLCVAPAYSWESYGPPSAYVDPWNVEHRPNPVIFPRMDGPSSYPETDSILERLSGQTEVSFGSPYQARRRERRDSQPMSIQDSPLWHSTVVHEMNGLGVGVQPTDDSRLTEALVLTPSTGPYEMDAVENEYNPWCHAPMPIVGRVPHRWEKMSGTNRMFFDAEQHLSRCHIEWNWDSFLDKTQTQTQNRHKESAIEPLRFTEFCIRTTSHPPFVEHMDGYDEHMSGVLDGTDCTHTSVDRSGLCESNGEELRSDSDIQRSTSQYHC